VGYPDLEQTYGTLPECAEVALVNGEIVIPFVDQTTGVLLENIAQ
jgi:hypothetical protein